MAGNSKLIVCKKAIFTPYTRNVWVSGGVREPGGGYSLWWPIQGGSARKGYVFQTSDIWKGTVSLDEVSKKVGKSVICVCERAQKS